MARLVNRSLGAPFAALLRALAATALVGSCILPPPVSLDEGSNANPFVTVARSVPSTADVQLNINCTSCTFQVFPQDPDIGDTLYARWYWDYDQTQLLAFESAAIAPPASGAVRLAAAYEITNVAQLKTQLIANKTDVHTLQVLVSDRPFETGTTAPPIEQVTKGLTTSESWTVEFVNDHTTCDTAGNLCTK